MVLVLGSVSLEESGPIFAAFIVDFDGYPRSVPPTLGAYTYLLWPEVFRYDFESGTWSAWSTVHP